MHINSTTFDMTSDDPRPAVADLIEKHMSQIKDIGQLLQHDPLYDPNIQDDLWILRYFLSHKNVRKAADAAKATLQYRKEHNLDEVGDIREQWDPNLHAFQQQQHQGGFYSCFEKDSLISTVPDKNRGVISYVIMKGIDQTKMVQTIDDDVAFKHYMHFKEWLFQVNDEVTRRTGRLTKALKVVDLKRMKLRHVNRAYMKRDAKLNKKLQDFYPQSLGSMLVVNASPIFESVWSMFRPFFPTRMVEKINVANPKKRPSDMLHFAKYVSEEDVPAMYGGKLTSWPPGRKLNDCN